MRIVSLVPSLSSTLVAIGLRPHLVGCTKFCVLPADLHRTTTSIGGTKDPDLEAIGKLRPTHILVNGEENKPEHIEACRAIADTLTTFPRSPHDVPKMLRAVHRFFSGAGEAEALAQQVDGLLREIPSPDQRRTYAYFIWRDPWMTIAGDTYISRSLDLLGWDNLYAAASNRYPTLEDAELAAINPEYYLLATEPYPFRKRDAQVLMKTWDVDPAKILRIDGRLTQWYGDLTVPLLEQIRDKKNAGFPAFCEPMFGA